MKNIGITKCMHRTADDFTTDFGLKARRIIDVVLRPILRLATKRKIVVESYPKLEKGKPYIFASTHHFDEDIIANLAIIDRNAWLLTGATHQVEYNPQFYAAWLHGMVYVDRRDDASRKESVKKMERLLKAGTSVVIYPEGGWNNTENLLIQKLFAWFKRTTQKNTILNNICMKIGISETLMQNAFLFNKRLKGKHYANRKETDGLSDSLKL